MGVRSGTSVGPKAVTLPFAPSAGLVTTNSFGSPPFGRRHSPVAAGNDTDTSPVIWRFPVSDCVVGDAVVAVVAGRIVDGVAESPPPESHAASAVSEMATPIPTPPR